MNRRALALLTALACFTVATPSAAVDVESLLNDFRIASWSGGDGITLGQVREITQDKHGYLWIASEAGLVRFDGFRFAASDLVFGAPTLPAAPSKAVYLAHDGSLWVGYASRYGLYHIADGHVLSISLKDQIEGFVNVITEDASGAIWVGHDGGLKRWLDGRWQSVDLPPAAAGTTASGLTSPQSGASVFDVHQDRAGVLWVATSAGLYRRTPGADRFERTAQGGVVRAISEDPSGGIWTTDDTGGFRRGGTAHPDHLFEGRGMSLFHDQRGNLWVATIGQGLWQVTRDARTTRNQTAWVVRRATVQTGLLSDETSAFLEDPDGNIWAGSNQGLHRLTPHKVRSLVDLGIVRAITVGPDGTAWAGTAGGLLAVDGTALTHRFVSGVGVHALHTAGDGTVWVATDTGLQRIAQGKPVPVPHGELLSHVVSMASDSRGTLWLCDETQGLVRVVNHQLVPVEVDPTWGRPVLTYAGRDDRVWIAFEGGAVRVYAPNGRLQQQYGVADGLPHSTVHAIFHDRRGGVWIGGNRGLSFLRRSRFETMTDRPGLSGHPVVSVADDDVGDLWLAVSAVGIVRIGRAQLSATTSSPHNLPRYQVYNAADGTAGLPYAINGGPVGNGLDGALWFVTSRGVTLLDPRALRKKGQSAPPRPRIEGVAAEDQWYAPLAGLALPPRPSRLRIDYTVPSLSSSNRIQFRYRLDGFDTDWVEGTGPRQAFYTNLPAGNYRFRLQAADSLGTWDQAETRMSFSILPMFYETGWFYAVCALALGLIAVGAWQLQVRRVRKEVALVFGERLRLSREIHDTLLQSLVGIALGLDAVSHDPDETSAPTRTRLTGLRRQVEEYIREVRQSIWDLRSPALHERGLVGALRATGERLTAGRVRFALTVTGTPRPCPSNVETHALRIGHEAIMNAVRHSSARHVQMEVGFESETLRLRITDDGGGFSDEPAADPDRHYGLATMRERAVDAGGRCTVESVRGSGVQVIAEFPLAPPAPG